MSIIYSKGIAYRNVNGVFIVIAAYTKSEQVQGLVEPKGQVPCLHRSQLPTFKIMLHNNVHFYDNGTKKEMSEYTENTKCTFIISGTY